MSEAREGDQVVAALRGRDEAAFRTLVDAWGATMLRVARTHVASDAAAEEVVQDTWLAVLQGLDGFAGRSSLRTWVFRILVNIARTRGVRDRRTTPMSDVDPIPTVDPTRFRGPAETWPGHWSSFPVSWPEPERGVLGHDLQVVVGGALATLPERQRLVVTLRDVLGMAADEVCFLLDVTDGNQRVLLHRGRAAVRARLEDHYGDEARWGATP